MADETEIFQQRKDGGWHKRRHKKDGHTYKKNTDVINKRLEKQKYFRPAWKDEPDRDFQETIAASTTNNPNHEPSVHADLEKSMQEMDNVNITKHPVRTADGSFVARCKFGGRRRCKSDHKNGPKAELQYDKPRLRNEYSGAHCANDDSNVNDYLKEGPDWPDASWYMAHEYDELFFPDFSLLDGRRCFYDRTKRVSKKMKLAVPIQELIIR